MLIIRGKQFLLRQLVALAIYYGAAQYLPSSSMPLLGSICKKLRYLCCKNIFEYCGRNVNIERRAFFGSGYNVRIGDNSGLGKNCIVPSDIVIGSNVMMGPNCVIIEANHSFSRVDVPMILQGHANRMRTVIEDDVWIGRQVIFTPGRTVRMGSIIAAGCVLSKDFDAYSIVGGNPARQLKSRIYTAAI